MMTYLVHEPDQKNKSFHFIKRIKSLFSNASEVLKTYPTSATYMNMSNILATLIVQHRSSLVPARVLVLNLEIVGLHVHVPNVTLKKVMRRIQILKCQSKRGMELKKRERKKKKKERERKRSSMNSLK